MQYIQVDINFRSIKKLDLPNLSASNIFYGFLILQGFSEKRKQSLKKKEFGPGAMDLSQAGPVLAACPAGLVERERCRPIQIGRRVAYLPRAIAHEGVGVAAG
jgi:hypothetical protein